VESHQSAPSYLGFRVFTLISKREAHTPSTMRSFARPRIARYVTSGPTEALNNEDLFRHYPELDRAE